nr:hypothetical protein [uncultured Roseococcus sp.]
MFFPVSVDWRTALAAAPAGGLALFNSASGPLAARQVARALLEEAAVLGGGQVLHLPGGDMLVGAQAAPGLRAGQLIAELTGKMPESWPLPEGRAQAEARCRNASPAGELPTLAALEARCAALPVTELSRLTFFAEDTSERPVAQRLAPVSLGLPDPGLEALAREWICRRLLAALADPAQRGALPALRPELRLILDLPQGGLSKGAATGSGIGALALLPLVSRADPARFASTEASLRAAGWMVGLVATDARALDWVEAPGAAWAVPVSPVPPRQLPDQLILLGQPVPDWARRPGVLHEVRTP